LLEINPPENYANQNRGQNIAKHLLIRIGAALLAILLLFSYSIFSDLGTNDSLGLLLSGAAFLLIWMFFLLIEALILHANKKPLLRNANFILILIPPFFIFIWLNTLY
jgi:hypothetical protein